MAEVDRRQHIGRFFAEVPSVRRMVLPVEVNPHPPGEQSGGSDGAAGVKTLMQNDC
jgi:hypothetical protein